MYIFVYVSKRTGETNFTKCATLELARAERDDYARHYPEDESFIARKDEQMRVFVLKVYHPHDELIGVYSTLERAMSACPNGPHAWALELNGYEWSCDWADGQVTYVITVKEMDK